MLSVTSPNPTADISNVKIWKHWYLLQTLMKRQFLSNAFVLHQKVFKKIQYQLMKICQFLTMVNIFLLDAIFLNQFIKDCVHYIFAGLFFMTKREHSWDKEEVFLVHLEIFFRSWDNQVLYFEIFKCYDVIW